MANPATKLVPLLRKQRAMQSLQAGGGQRQAGSARGARRKPGRSLSDRQTPAPALRAGQRGAAGRMEMSIQGVGSACPPTPLAETWGQSR